MVLSRSRLRGVAPLVVALSLALAAATVASGLEPSPAAPVPDSAFRPVVLAPAQRTSPSTDELGPLADPQPPMTLAPRPQPSLPAAKPIEIASTTHSISGLA